MNKVRGWVGCLALVLALLAPRFAWTQEPGGWSFAVGTGLQRLNAKGDVGFSSPRGAERAAIDLTPDDFNDLMESAFGFQAAAVRDRWQFNLAYGNMALEDSTSLRAAGLPALDVSVQQDIVFAEFTAVYRFAELAGHRFGVLGGVRNTRHDYSLDIESGGGTISRKLDSDWTDALIGLTHAVELTDRLEWSTSAAVGLGESDSYWSARTVLGWRFASSWSLGLFVEYRGIDFENGDPGDPDWYLYDADEWGPGISILYLFR